MDILKKKPINIEASLREPINTQLSEQLKLLIIESLSSILPEGVEVDVN